MGGVGKFYHSLSVPVCSLTTKFTLTYSYVDPSVSVIPDPSPFPQTSPLVVISRLVLKLPSLLEPNYLPTLSGATTPAIRLHLRTSTLTYVPLFRDRELHFFNFVGPSSGLTGRVKPRIGRPYFCRLWTGGECRSQRRGLELSQPE